MWITGWVLLCLRGSLCACVWIMRVWLCVDYVPLTCMCQTESPKSEVRGGVGDAAQAVLDGVDGLMHEHVCSVKPLQRAQFKRSVHSNLITCKSGYTWFFLTSSSAAAPSTSPWQVLMEPSSDTSGRLSSSWCHRGQEICQDKHPTLEKKKRFKSDQSNTNSPLDVVFSWMRGIHLWDYRAGGWGPNKLPAPPGPSAPQTTCEQWQDQLLDFWAAHGHFSKLF